MPPIGMKTEDNEGHGRYWPCHSDRSRIPHSRLLADRSQPSTTVLRLEFSTAVLAGEDSAAPPYPPGTAFQAIFGGEGLAAASELAQGALAGRGDQAEVSLMTPGGAGRPSPVVLATLRRGAAVGLPDRGRERGRPTRGAGAPVRPRGSPEGHPRQYRRRHHRDRPPRGRIEGLNQAAARIAGRGAEALVGQRISELMSEPYRSAHQSHIQRYLETGASGILNVGPRRAADAAGRWRRDARST